MDAPCIMYRVPLIHDSRCDVVLPDCMYKMKSIHEPVNMTSERELPEAIVADDRLAELQKKQEEILLSLSNLTAKLKALKADVITYVPADCPVITSKELKADVSPISATATPAVQSKLDDGFVDVVIYASPSQPAPVSLLVMSELLQTKFAVLTNCHVHSETTNVHPQLAHFLATSNEKQRASYQMSLTLIWKEVGDDVRMTVNPFKNGRVDGEVNVVRFLSNLAASSIRNPDAAAPSTEVDKWLDVAHFSVVQGNNKEQQSAIRYLNSKLGKSRYLVGDELTAADVFMWSALNRCKLVRDAPANVKTWFGVCQKHAIFHSAMQFVEKHEM